jgi:hypothetical protein
MFINVFTIFKLFNNSHDIYFAIRSNIKTKLFLTRMLLLE